MKLYRTKRKRELTAEMIQLRSDLRTTVAMLRKVVHGTHMEQTAEPNLRRIYERLCP